MNNIHSSKFLSGYFGLNKIPLSERIASIIYIHLSLGKAFLVYFPEIEGGKWF